MTEGYDKNSGGAWLGGIGVLEGFDVATRAAPAAGDLLDDLGEHILVFDGELAAERIVVEGAGTPRHGDVEACEVAARCAAVAGGHGLRTLVSGRWSHVSGPCATS